MTKKSIYKKPLKDINKDGKRNFGDTWLGDLVGADGKAGVQGPKMKASIAGARRGSTAKKKPSPTKKKPIPSKTNPSGPTTRGRGKTPANRNRSPITTTKLKPYQSESDSRIAKGADRAIRAAGEDKAMSMSTMSPFKKWLAAKGIPYKTLTIGARSILKSKYDKEMSKPKAKTPGGRKLGSGHTGTTKKHLGTSTANLNKGGAVRVRYQPSQKSTPKYPDRGK